MKKLLLALMAFLFFAFPRPTFADTNFGVSSNVTYAVNPSGSTHVIFAVTLKNKTDKYYASSYTLHLGFQDISSVTASDGNGSIAPSIKKTSDGEDITVNFNKKATGLNAILPFQLAFDTNEVASLNGSIWEVNIPGLSNSSDFENFSVHVVVPSYFGSPIYRKPAVGDNSLTFTKDQLGSSGISLAFGDKQVYAFHLIYHLKNAQLFPVRTELALPPETSYQHIEIENISPKPTTVSLDTDKNWLAQYRLMPSQTLTVIVDGKAFLSLTPTAQQLSLNEQTLFTKQNTYWDTQNPKIQQLAQDLKTPEAIYRYVVKTLTYDFARVSDTQVRLGALGVLAHPDQAVCLEFTDLFIAIARAAGIPARELDGYAYTQNTIERPLSLQKEVLHAWPEYYDKTRGTWVMVDPTWENTTGGVDYFHTFDFDHLTLAIKGVSSTYPVPAGGYKLPGQEAEKDVAVTFAPQSVAPDPVVSVITSLPAEVTAGLPIGGSVSLQNTGHVLFPSQNMQIISSLAGTQHLTTEDIPPYGESIIPLSLGKSAFLTNSTDTVTIQLAGKAVVKSIRIAAFSLLAIILLGGVLLAIFTLIILIITRRSRRLPIPQQ